MLVSEMYRKVAEDLNLPLERVVEYDKKMWEWVKLSLNNPTSDVIEIPLLGSFSITNVKMRKTLRSKIIMLRKLKNKRDRFPNNEKIQRDVDIQTNLVKNLWKLRKMCKFI